MPEDGEKKEFSIKQNIAKDSGLSGQGAAKQPDIGLIYKENPIYSTTDFDNLDGGDDDDGYDDHYTIVRQTSRERDTSIVPRGQAGNSRDRSGGILRPSENEKI